MMSQHLLALQHIIKCPCKTVFVIVTSNYKAALPLQVIEWFNFIADTTTLTLRCYISSKMLVLKDCVKHFHTVLGGRKHATGSIT